MLEILYLFSGFIFIAILCIYSIYKQFIKFRLFKHKFIAEWYKFIREQNLLRFMAMEYFLKQENDDKTSYDIIYNFLFDDSVSSSFGAPVITYKERKGPQFFDFEYAILNKSGVCRHIAFIFFIVCTYHGLYCSIYHGKCRESGTKYKILGDGHAWNSIKINNKEYAVDLTNPEFDNIDFREYVISEDELANYKGKKQDEIHKILKMYHIHPLVKLHYFFLPINQ